MFELQNPWINYCWINCLFFMDQVWWYYWIASPINVNIFIIWI